MFFTSLSNIRMTESRSFWPDFMAAFMSSCRRVCRSILIPFRFLLAYYVTEGTLPTHCRVGFAWEIVAETTVPAHATHASQNRRLIRNSGTALMQNNLLEGILHIP